MLLAVALLSLFSHPKGIALRHVALELPGPPVASYAADLDGDGRRDVAFVVDYAAWGSVATITQQGADTTLDVIPALEQRREVIAFLAKDGGGYGEAISIALPRDVFSIGTGGAKAPLIALGASGISAIAMSSGALAMTEIAHARGAFEGSEAFLGDVGLVRDVDGDGAIDVLFPAHDGVSLFRGAKDGSISRTPAWTRALPGDESTSGAAATRFVPLPVVRGGSLVVRPRTSDDPLVFVPHEGAPKRVALPHDESSPDKTDLVFVGDLSHDRATWVVTRDEPDRDDEGLHFAPKSTYRFYRLGEGGEIGAPYSQLAVVGEAADDDGEIAGGFIDLDGDGRLDLVTITADISKWQIVRALTTKRIDVKLDFHVYRQESTGLFRAVAGKLDETLKLDLNDLALDRTAAFSGDFDGDGKIDFVRFGDSANVEIRRGGDGCRYPEKPDLVLDLPGAPDRLSALRVVDVDGDGRADLAFTHLLAPAEPGASARVRVDLYLSSEAAK